MARSLAEHAGACERESIADGETIAALRRERDALQAVVDAVAAHVADNFDYRVQRLVRMAKNAKAAAKGVG